MSGRSELDNLSEDVKGLKNTVPKLIEAVEGYQRSDAIERRVRRRANLTLVAVVIAVGYNIWLTSRLHAIANANNSLSTSNARILKTLDSATGPDAQQRQARSIAAILRQLDVNQRNELQQVLNAIFGLSGKTAPTLQSAPSPTVTPVTPTTASPPTTQAAAPRTTRTTRSIVMPTTTTRPRAPPSTTTTRPPIICVGSVCVRTVSATPADPPKPKGAAPMTDINFVLVAAMGTLVFTVVNFLKYLTNRNWNAALTQLVAWLAGWLVVFVAAQTQWADGVRVGGIALSKLNWASLLMFGTVATSVLSSTFTLTSVVASQPVAAAAKLFPKLPHVVFSVDPVPPTTQPPRAPNDTVPARRVRKGLPPDA